MKMELNLREGPDSKAITPSPGQPKIYPEVPGVPGLCVLLPPNLKGILFSDLPGCSDRHSSTPHPSKIPLTQFLKWALWLLCQRHHPNILPSPLSLLAQDLPPCPSTLGP